MLTRRMGRGRFACLAIYLCSAWPAAGQPAAPASLTAAPASVTEEEDSLRCWWRTSTPAIRIGETLSVILTCSAVDTPSLTVLVDETQLSPEAIALAPLEVLDGVRAVDLREGGRRFIQHEYRARLLGDSLFGSDAVVPPVTLSYRTQSRAADGTATEGIERKHELPPLAVRVLSLVPADARDIREAPVPTLAELDDAAFRARALTAAGGTLLGVGGLMLAVALVARVTGSRAPARARPAALSEAKVLSAAREELAAIRPGLDGSGWTPTLAARALGALRIAGAPLVSRRASQRPTDGRTAPEGGLIREGPAGPLLISSPITPDTVLRYRASLPEADGPERRQTLDGLQQALASLTRASYGAEGSLSADLRLDDALTFSEGLVAAQLREHRWVARQWRSIRQRAARLGRRA